MCGRCGVIPLDLFRFPSLFFGHRYPLSLLSIIEEEGVEDREDELPE